MMFHFYVLCHFLYCILLLDKNYRQFSDIYHFCETPENPNFLRKDKMVISVKIRNFSRSQMTKRTSSLESSREI